MPRREKTSAVKRRTASSARGSEQLIGVGKVQISGERGTKGSEEGEGVGERGMRSSPVGRRESSVWKVELGRVEVREVVRAREESSQGSGGWYVMARTVKSRTERTKREKQRLEMSLIRVWPIGDSAVELVVVVLVLLFMDSDFIVAVL